MRISGTQVIRRAIGWTMLIFFTSTGYGQGMQVQLDSIRFETSDRFSSSILLSESLLEVGEHYSTQEIEHGVNRIVRLPFVLGAEYELVENDRGRYDLVVSVRETRRVFLGTDALFREGDRPDSFLRPDRIHDLPAREDLLIDLNEDDRSFYAGYRFGIGNHGVTTVAMDPSATGRVFLEHTQYNLFNRRLKLRLRYEKESLERQSREVFPGEEVAETYGIQAFLPLKGNHGLSVEATLHQFDRFNQYRFGRLFSHVDDDTTRVQIAWIFDSLDDETFFLEGSRLKVGLEAARVNLGRREEGQFSSSLPPRSYRWEFIDKPQAARLSAVRFWPFARTLSAYGNLAAAYEIGDFEISGRLPPTYDLNGRFFREREEWGGEFTVGLAYQPLQNRSNRTGLDLRLEVEGAYFYGDKDPRLRLVWRPAEGYQLQTTLKFRGAWGVVGASLAYVDQAFNRESSFN